jgi:LytS/YehU family sensor histidine kinase
LFLARAGDAQSDFEQALLAKYEQAITQAEELGLYEEDPLETLSKIRRASKAIVQNNFQEADRVLDEVVADLSLLQHQRPTGVKRRLRQLWLEIYVDLFQKFAVLALLGYLFVRSPFFRKMLKVGQLSVFGKTLVSFFVVFFAVLLSFFDLSRYGESAWAFFDIQVVLLTIGGLVGGLWSGIFAGITVGGFRWLIVPHPLIYSGIVAVAGLLSGLSSHWVKSYRTVEKMSFGVGVGMGTLHGALIYLPLSPWMPWIYVALSIFLLALLEGVGVFIFFAVVSGVLRESERREVVEELLKTRILFLQAQMRPHFLFNALNAISAICSREKAPEAQRLILRLSEFLRRAVRQESETVTLREELDYVDAYLELEKARLQERLKVEKDIPVDASLGDLRIPLLVVQPLVENAVRHGISMKETGGTVKIRIAREDGILKIEVEDNGIGRDPEFFKRLLSGGRSAERETVGIGIRNIQQRLLRLYGPSFGLQFEGAPLRGTKVTVRIPITQKGENR